MLNDTGACSRASITKVSWDSDGEGGLVGRDSLGVIGEVRVIEKDVAHNGVGSSVDDGDICCSSMGGTNVEGEGDDLSSSKGLDIGSVVGILVSLAEPDVTLSFVVVGLSSSDLKLSLNISVTV